MTAPQDPFAAPDPNAEPSPGPPPGPAAGQPAPYGQSAGQPPAYGQPAAYGQTPYGQAPYGAGIGSPRNGLGTAALVLGILAFLGSITIVGGIGLGVLAIVLGFIGRGRAKRGEATNGGSALAGIVLGGLGMVLSLALIAFGVSLLNSDKGQDLQDCLAEAGNDQAAVQACQNELLEDFGR